MSRRFGLGRPAPERSRLPAAVALSVAVVAAAVPQVAASSLRFSDVTARSGIGFRMTSGGTPSREILEVDGGGVALFDFDGDGDLDLFLANGATLDSPDKGPGSRLYANDGTGAFRDVTAAAGIAVRGWAMGVAVADYDGDGRDDLYVTCKGPDVLLRNETTPGGPARFRDVTAKAGLGDPRWSTSAAFGDVDGDGDLDLYVVHYVEFDPRDPPGRAVFQGVAVMAGPAGLTGQADALYVNDGEGRFRDASAAVRVALPERAYGLGVRIADFDEDGRPDVFVGNDSTENFLFRGLGEGRFREAAMRSGIAANYDGATQATMGIALADVNGDGRADVFTTNFSHDTNTLHVSARGGAFEDRTSQYGLALVSRPYLGWGCGFYDFDSDGDEDLFISNGHVYPEATSAGMGTEYEQRPLLFERRGARFEPVDDAGEALSRPYRGRAAAFGDFDGDGDTDVVLTTLNGPVHLLRNDAPHRRVVVVELEQPGANHRAYGATVELEVAGRVQRRFITGGGSFQSADAPVAGFGLGDGPAEPRELRVRWPDGKLTRVATPPLGRRLVIRRGAEPEIGPLRRN